jgi:hypothetical protein
VTVEARRALRHRTLPPSPPSPRPFPSPGIWNRNSPFAPCARIHLPRLRTTIIVDSRPVPARDRIKTSKPGSVCSHRSHALLTTNIHPSLLDAPSICPHSTDLLVAPLCRAPAHPQRHILVLLGRELLRNCTCPSARIGEKGA